MNRILHKLVGPAALLLGFGLAGPAIAQVQSSASATNLRYTLGDLRSADGQAPGVSFTSPAGSLHAGGSVSDVNGVILFEQGQSLLWPQQSAGVAWKDAIGSSAALTPGGVLGPMGVQGGSAVAGVAADAQEKRYSIGQGGWDASFRLAPYSSLTLSVDADVAANVVPDGLTSLYATSNASLRGFGAFSDGQVDTQFGLDNVQALAYQDAVSGNPQAHEAGTLSITFINPNASWGDGHFYFDFAATAQLQPLSPVPEPASGAQLTGGLAALGLGRMLARRRKKRGAAAPLDDRA